MRDKSALPLRSRPAGHPHPHRRCSDGGLHGLGKHNAASLLEKVLFLGGWTWITTSFPTLAKAFRDSLIAAGFIAGGKGIGDHTILSDPSHIAGMGFSLTEPILALAENANVLMAATCCSTGFVTSC